LLACLRVRAEREYVVRSASDAILGVVSLILWALILIISVKYALLILRADNRGEGGIVALLARQECAAWNMASAASVAWRNSRNGGDDEVCALSQ
jgi:K+ transporter